MAAQAVGVSPPPEATSQPSQLLQVGRGDQLRVEVFGSPELATTTSVADDGSIHIPFAGPVIVVGLSPSEAARKVATALKAGDFLVNPQVSVTVIQSLSQRVSVLGEVRSPGRYVIESDTTVFDLIAKAGGRTEKGSDTVYILRPDASGVLQRLPVDTYSVMTPSADGSVTPIQTLRGGDSILVPKATFMITGQISAPGEYRIEGEMLLFQAIARAGGVTAMGSTSRVEIRRRGPDDKFINIKGKTDMQVQPGDVIKVKERLF